MAGNEKSPCGLRDIRQATGGLWESRERRRVRVAFMAKWVRLHPSEPLLWGNALHSFDFQLFRFLSCYFLFITQKHHTFVWRFCCASFSSTHFGAEGGIRTPARYYPPTPLAGEPLIATWVLLHGCKLRVHYLLWLEIKSGGESGIRTHGSFESPVFKTGSLNRSDISPYRLNCKLFYHILSH